MFAHSVLEYHVTFIKMHFYFDECGMTGLMFTEIVNYKGQLPFVSIS